MQSLKQKLQPVLFFQGVNKHSAALFAASIITAFLIGIIAEIYGEVIAVLSLLLVIVVAAAMWNYKCGILLAIVMLPISSTSFIPRELFGITGFNPLNLALLFSAAALIFAWMLQPTKIFFPKWSRHFGFYLAVLAFAALHGAFHVSAIPAYFKLLKIINFDSAGGYVRDVFLKPMLIMATAFMLAVVVSNAIRPALFLIPLLCSAIVLPILVIAYVVMSGVPLSALAASDARGFLSVTGMHANELGLMFNMAFALTLFCFFSAHGLLAKSVLGLAGIILVAAVTLTFSRGAYMGLLAVVGYVLYTHRKFRIMLAVLLLIALAAFLMPDAVLQRASIGVATGNVEDISAGRVSNIWQPLLLEVISSPLYGHGLDSILWSEAAQRRTILPVGHTHSAYLGVLLDVGILGSMVFFLFFRHMWQLFMRLAEQAPEPIFRGFFRGAAACILLLLVQGLTDDSFAPTRTQPFLWMAYGMAIGLVARTHGVNAGYVQPTNKRITP